MLYAFGGLVVAILVASGIAGCEHKQRVAAQAETMRVQARFDAFAEDARRLGEEQNEAALKQEERNHATLVTVAAQLNRDIANRDDAIRRLRERPIVRPDNSTVPIVAGCPEGVDGTAEERVSVTEYRALEARAYDDALHIIRLQEWVSQTGHPVE